MKYFSPSYWFKLWVLSAPLFKDKTQGINAMSIDNNQKIKDWASNNTDLQSIENQEIIFINSSSNYQTYLDVQALDKNLNRFKRNIIKDENNYLQTQNVSASDYLEFNNKYIRKIGKEINTFVADSNDNIYFGIKNELFVLKSNETTVTKINEVLNDIILLEIDNKDNMYFCTNNGFYFLKPNENVATKINEEINNINSIKFDSKDDVYIGTDNGLFVLKNGEKILTKIEGINEQVNNFVIDSNNNIYIGTDNGLFVLKNGEKILTKIEGINEQVNNFVIDSNNNIYIGTGSKLFTDNDNNVYVLKNGETIAKRIDYIFGLISTLVFDNSDNLYIGTNNGIYILKQNETQVNKIKHLNKFIFDLSIDNNNNLYIATDLGTYLFTKNELLQLINKKTNNYYDSFCKVVKNNNVFIKINEILYYLTDLNLSIVFKKIDGAPSSSIDLIEIDKNDNIYIGTNYDNPQILKWNEGKAYNIDGIIDHKFFSIKVDKDNNIYFGSINGLFVLKNGETTAKRIDLTIGTINNITFDKDNNIYIGTDNGLFVLKNGEKILTKIEGINEQVNNFVIDSNNNIYIGTDNGLFVLKNGETTTTKINKIKNYVLSLVITENDNIYIITEKKQRLSSYVSDNNVYVLKNGETTAERIQGINENNRAVKFVIDSNNHVYIGTDNGLFVLKNGETTAKRSNWLINISEYTKNKFDSKKNMYISANDGLYVLKSGEDKPTKINGINEWVNNFVIDSNDNIIFIDRRINFGFLETKLLINSILKISNLEKIDNADDETILNTLNFLNRENNYFLNLNKMQVFNKTTNSVIIEVIKGKYRGQVTVNYKIKNQDEINNIDLIDLLKKVIYFYFIDNNYHVFDKIKDIKDINIENLNFWNIEVTRDSQLTRIDNFKEICKKETRNTSPIIKDIHIPKCEYNSTSKLEFQITKGLSKINQENKMSGWNINIEDENKLNDFVLPGYQHSEIELELSDKFDISNINKQEKETILYYFNEGEDKLQLAPKERLEFLYSIREINRETSLNLNQKITGTFSAKIINDNSEEENIEIPVKKAMQTLQKYSLLPDEITIDEADSITFNGKAKISSIREKKPEKIENYFSI